MTIPLLTTTEVLAHFRRRDRHSLRTLVQAGLIEAFNVSGVEGHGARYLYRIKDLTPVPPELTPGDLRLAQIMREEGL